MKTYICQSDIEHSHEVCYCYLSRCIDWQSNSWKVFPFFLTLFFMGEGKFYPAKIFLPNLVLKVFWKFQFNSMPISKLLTILWGEVIQCFLKQNFLYYYKNYATSRCHNLLNIYSFLLMFDIIWSLFNLFSSTM